MLYFCAFRHTILTSLCVTAVFIVITTFCFIMDKSYNALAAANKESSIFLKIDKNSFSDSDVLRASVMADPAGQNINAIGMDLDFDPSYLSVENVEYATSVCEFIIPENRNNETGVLNAACGSPDIQATTTIKMLDITFSKKTAGWADIDLGGSKILAADGLGTDILDHAEYHRIYLEK